IGLNASDGITVLGYQLSPQQWPQGTLQIIGADVRTYDLNAVVADFKAALAQDPGLVDWSAAASLVAHQLSVSTTEALGGATAYEYATTGSVDGLITEQKQAVLADPNFGSAPQSIAAPEVTIAGTAGNDTLLGTPGNDTLIGGAGNDTLVGGGGSDTYVFNLGDGVDTIVDTGTTGTDTLAFGAGIPPDSLSLGIGSLLVRVGSDGDAIHIEGFDPSNAASSGAIEQFSFADGTVLINAQLLERGFDLFGTGVSQDTIQGTSVQDRIHGTGVPEVLDGLAGNDTLLGAGGNDTLRGGEGDDYLDGGTGNDDLLGGKGSDSYFFDRTSGDDRVLESQAD